MGKEGGQEEEREREDGRKVGRKMTGGEREGRKREGGGNREAGRREEENRKRGRWYTHVAEQCSSYRNTNGVGQTVLLQYSIRAPNASNGTATNTRSRGLAPNQTSSLKSQVMTAKLSTSLWMVQLGIHV